jgi:hypothetical protein
VAFTTVVYWARKYLVRLVSIEPFLTLGKASLKVFCAHIFFVFVGLAFLYGDFNADGLDQLRGIPAIGLLAVTFTALIVVATNEVRKKHAERDRRKREQAHIHDSDSGGSHGAAAMDSVGLDMESAASGAVCRPDPVTAMAKTGT